MCEWEETTYEGCYCVYTDLYRRCAYWNERDGVCGSGVPDTVHRGTLEGVCGRCPDRAQRA